MRSLLSADGQSEMNADHIRARLDHRLCLLFFKHKRHGKQAEEMRDADSLDLPFEYNALLLERMAERAVDQSDGREIVDTGESSLLNGFQILIQIDGRVGGVQTENHRGIQNRRQKLSRAEGHHQLIAVGITKQAGERPQPDLTEMSCAERENKICAAAHRAPRRHTASGRNADTVSADPNLPVQSL